MANGRLQFDVFRQAWIAAQVRTLTGDEAKLWTELFMAAAMAEEPGVLRGALEVISDHLAAPAVTLQSIVRKGALKGAHRGARCEEYAVVDRRGNPVVLLAGQPGPVWYIPEILRAEHLRRVAAEAGRKGGSPVLRTPKGAPDDTLKGVPRTLKGAPAEPSISNGKSQIGEIDTLKGDTLKGAPPTLKGAPVKTSISCEKSQIASSDTLKGAPPPDSGAPPAPLALSPTPPIPEPPPSAEASASDAAAASQPAATVAVASSGRRHRAKGRLPDSSRGLGGDPDYRRLTDHWVQAYAIRYGGVAYPFDGQDGVMISEVWRRVNKDLDLGKRVLDAYLADRDRFYEGHPLKKLRADVMKFVTRAQARGGSNGRHSSTGSASGGHVLELPRLN